MISIDFPEPTSQAWIDWRKECQEETQKLIEAFEQSESIDIDGKIYKKQGKDVFFNPESVFRGKCIFCERRLFISQHGDVEHFRPKGAVKNLDKADVDNLVKDLDKSAYKENGNEHPGYFWLAYDWTNLIPACVRCNQPNTDRFISTALGKRNYFPLATEFRSFTPEADYKLEQPLLLNPVLDKVEEHIDMSKLGVLFDKTSRGKATIDILGLNERGLPDARKDIYKNVFIRAFNFLTNINHEQDDQDYLMSFKLGSAEFSIAGRKAINDALAVIAKRQAILNPSG